MKISDLAICLILGLYINLTTEILDCSTGLVQDLNLTSKALNLKNLDAMGMTTYVQWVCYLSYEHI
jgi:hypothetical protein